MIDKVICNRYKILQHLGTGGMATVWLAEDTILNRKVAIKTLKIDNNDESAIKRFNREANAVTSLSHPNIVSIYDIENEGNFYYLILEYVEGMTLKDYMINNSNIPLDKVILIMKQIASGLFNAHKNGIIHRDIKPQNILLTQNLDCKITDFGISRTYDDTTLTQTNQMLGTVYYLSPEQARGNVATAQSDIYSLGILMFEMITGRIPFKGESAVAIALKHLQEELPNIDKYRDNIPQSIKNILIKATMKNPNERYLSAKEFCEDLETCLDSNRLNETEYKGFVSIKNNKNFIEEDDYLDEIEDDYIEEYYEEEKPKNKEKQSSFFKILFSGIFIILLAVGAFFAYNLFNDSYKVSVPELKNLRIEDAKLKISSAGLRIGEIIEVNSDTVDEDLVISTDPLSGKKVKKGTEINIKVSKGKDTIETPNYLGMTENEVKTALRKIEFKNIIFEKEQSDEYAEGKVMKQSLPAGKEIIPKDTIITITISSGSKDIIVPNIEGKTKEEAFRIIFSSGLDIEKTEEEESEKPKGTVIRQSLAPDSKVKKGTKITIIIAKEKKRFLFDFNSSNKDTNSNLSEENNSNNNRNKKEGNSKNTDSITDGN